MNLYSNYSNTSIWYVYEEDMLFLELNMKFLGKNSSFHILLRAVILDYKI